LSCFSIVRLFFDNFGHYSTFWVAWDPRVTIVPNLDDAPFCALSSSQPTGILAA